MPTVSQLPEVGSQWVSGDRITADNHTTASPVATRVLVVDEVVPLDPQGREVRGWLEHKPGDHAMYQRYATSLKIFWHVWKQA